MLYTLFDPINWNVLKSSKSSLDDLHLKLLLANLADDPAQRDRVFEEYCKFLTQPIELAIQSLDRKNTLQWTERRGML
ncbi:hypothetical protein HDV01_004747 [Terramyces sp. JEL0728]|nr:hypothetical protein HDV01_004747 [Terramyces sp. JEL0728]